LFSPQESDYFKDIGGYVYIQKIYICANKITIKARFILIKKRLFFFSF